MSGRDRAPARRAALRRLIDAGRVASQADAVRLLAARGHAVTQTTVSRDLTAIGAVKDNGGPYRLAPAAAAASGPTSDLAHMLREFAVAIDPAGQMVVVKTVPGSASPVATALDLAAVRGVVGTVAGDDTVLVVGRTPRAGATVANHLEKLMEGRTA